MARSHRHERSAVHGATHLPRIECRPPADVPGTMRPYRPGDRDLALRWLDAFIAEALPSEHVHEAAEVILERRVDEPEGGLVLWHVDDEPVSLAGFGGPTPDGIRIGPVYTPPELRRHGYASALVGRTTAMLLGSGRRFCFLFTDLANSTSNNIYRNVGYEAVTDVDQYAFDEAPLSVRRG